MGVVAGPAVYTRKPLPTGYLRDLFLRLYVGSVFSRPIPHGIPLFG